MSDEEYRTQLTIWAMLAAPLLLGNDVRALGPGLLEMLRNREVVAVDQDPLGRPAQYVGLIKQTQIWARPLAGGRTALGLYNLGQAPFRVQLQFAALALPPSAPVRDLWRGQDLGVVSDVDVQLPPHGAALLVVSAPPPR
jgi:alpha-galactosidase